MLRRDTPKGDRSELNSLLRRLAGPGGSVRLTLGGEELARIEGPADRAGATGDRQGGGDEPAADRPAADRPAADRPAAD
ncbi:hypothetical protein [Conexibacter arvalis]|uniref:Uncharacterized protein n=1 Tax=Conexibacter arvalis TaxID=912552 RepID=A0A840IDX2_9ACTN|nr:hypothetical protein [Conexibacter arvalis]MBB4662545.1 hypothetical protein [Conexibacter arvalis]